MGNFRILINFFLVAILVTSCANYGLHHRTTNHGSLVMPVDEEAIIHRVYLIGDGGNAPMDDTTPLLKALDNKLAAEKIPASCIWLGDNIYPVGLAPENHPDYSLGKHRLLVQASATLEFNGNVFFIPGNHDWYTYGEEGLGRQENLIEDYLQQNKIFKNQKKDSYFLPNNGCPGPEVVHLNQDILLVIIDSQWYISESYKKEGIDTPCETKTRSELDDALLKVFESNKEKSIILVSHHPLYTYGKHGGIYSLKENIFPFSQLHPNLIIPLPISGILFNKLRPKITEQDIKNNNYLSYINHIEEIATKHENVMVASGHEHTLQFIIKNKIPFIVSGSGSKKEEVKLGADSIFAAGSHGFAVIDFFNNNKRIIRFYILNNGMLEEVFNYYLPQTD